MARPHVLVIDPAVKRPAVRAFNRMVLDSELPMTYHQPAMYGLESLKLDTEGVVGIMVLGSAASVNETHPWQDELRVWLKPLLEAKIPTLGICYGHQMLAHLFGGKVDFVRPSQEKLVGFRMVELEANALWGDKPTKGMLKVSHCETVVKCPTDMHIIGRSDVIAIEALAHKSLPIWSFQPHPECVPGQMEEDKSGLPKSGPEAYKFGYGLVKHFLDYVKKRGK